MASSRVPVYINVALVAIFCLALAGLPVLSVSGGTSWTSRIAGFGGALSDMLHAAPKAAASAILIPLVAAIACVIALLVVLRGIRGRYQELR